MSNSQVEVLEKLKGFKIFQGMSRSDLAQLSYGVTFTVLAADSLLFLADAPVEVCYLVTFGSVKLVRQVDTDSEAIMTFRGTGDFIAAGVMILSEEPQYPVTAITTEDTGLLRIPTKVFNREWRLRPEVLTAVQQTVFERLSEYQDDKTLASQPVNVRIARFLIRTLENQSSEYGNTLMVRLSRKDIADRVGSTVETVIRILSEWTKKGWLATHERRVTILNREALSQLRKTEKLP